MEKKIPDFSDKQWNFLAVLDAFGTSVSIAIIGQLVPLLPGPLFEVINQAKEKGWLVQDKEDQFTLSKNLPVSIKKKLSNMNTPEHMTVIVHQLQNLPPDEQIDPKLMIQLLDKAGQEKEAVNLQVLLAENFLKEGNHEQAWCHLNQVAGILARLLDDEEHKALYISVTLQLSSLSFKLGKNLAKLPEHLSRAHEVSQKLGDRRSHAIINMHLGRLYYFSDRREDAIVALSLGTNEIEELSDEDMLDQSAVFSGLFYFMQGLFKKALPYLERAHKLYETQERGQFMTPLVPMFLGYTLLYLGELHRAIGTLDCLWRMTRERSDNAQGLNSRVVLCTILFLSNRETEANIHLDEIMEELKSSDNELALYLARGAQTLKAIKSGQVVEARKIIGQAFEGVAEFGLVRQFASPWVMEMIYEFDKLGLEPLPAMGLEQMKERSIRENNIHLLGVALRLDVQKKIGENKPIKGLLNDLKKSESYLEQSGDIVQLSKSIIVGARLEISRGNFDEGRRRGQKAWIVLGGYANDFFPNDLKYLVGSEQRCRRSPETPQDSFERYIELTESMFPVHSQDEILSRAIVAINRFFGAERGGLFWFADGNKTNKPELQASCNLTINDVEAASFRSSLSMVIKAHEKNQPVLHRNRQKSSTHSARSIKAILCLPIKNRGKVEAVLYHDNSYLEDCFDFLDTEILAKMMSHVSRQIERIMEFFQIREERNDLIIKKALHEESVTDNSIIHKSRAMKELMVRLGKAAQSDSTILISGETGVGKEMIASQVHSMSPRRDKAYIIVDATTIPEGLIESELFGNEKGAFTGADRQKIGRLELADQGTLFIDEIGELPKSIQVKLLRVIQEHSFMRLGGVRPMRSSFRLIAATNRNLAKEVSAGRFREDLYYRLNVVPLQVPPLRDRYGDVALLARYFLKLFTKRHHRPNLSMDPETEKLLEHYDWPGNVRELENIVERAVLLSSGEQLEVDLPLRSLENDNHPFVGLPTMDELQREYIEYVLDRTGGKLSGPGGGSEILGLKRTTLVARMKKLGLR